MELKRVIPTVELKEDGSLVITLPPRPGNNGGWVGLGSKDRPWVPFSTKDGKTVLVSCRAFIPTGDRDRDRVIKSIEDLEPF